MRNTLVVLGLLAVLMIVLLRGCVTVQVHLDPSAWFGGSVHEPGSAEASSRSALRSAQREAQERERREKAANLDAIVATGVRIGTDAQAYYLKPAAFGGGSHSFEGINLEKMGYLIEPDSSLVTLDGVFSLELVPESGVRIVGQNEEYGHRAVVSVTGPRADDLSTQIKSL